MIGLDTNVLIRYIMQDDPMQSPKATALIEALTTQERGYVTVVSIVEIFWVLSKAYDLEKTQIVRIFETLLRARELTIESKDRVLMALRSYTKSNADFPDCLIESSAKSAGCDRVLTFDIKASRQAGMSLIP